MHADPEREHYARRHAAARGERGEHEGRRRGRSRQIAAGGALIVISAFGAIVWYAYQVGLRTGSENVAPVIQAEEGPIKVRPEQPGGMEVPDQDKLVYERVTPEAPVERLLPPPEAPMAKPPPPPPAAGPAPPTPSTLVLGTGASSGAAATLPEPPPLPPAPVTNGNGSVVIPPPPPPVNLPPADSGGSAAVPPPPPRVSLTAPKESAPAATTRRATGPAPQLSSALPIARAWRVQVAAMRTPEDAQKAWREVFTRHRDLIGGLTPTVMRVDLGPSKGIYYRVQAGPLPDSASAKALCERLGQRRVGCLIVKP